VNEEEERLPPRVKRYGRHGGQERQNPLPSCGVGAIICTFVMRLHEAASANAGLYFALLRSHATKSIENMHSPVTVNSISAVSGSFQKRWQTKVFRWPAAHGYLVIDAPFIHDGKYPDRKRRYEDDNATLSHKRVRFGGLRF
jgi:hypothetical protein